MHSQLLFIKYAEFSDIDKIFKTQIILRMYFGTKIW